MYTWQHALWQQLRDSFQQKRFHHAQLFIGLPGVGKFDLVKVLASTLLCERPEGFRPCNACKACGLLAAETHPDKLLISAESNSIGVDAIRALSDFIHHSALQGGNKVVLIKDAEKMTHSAANALLKTLEEPNLNRYILLTCNDKSQLPATVLSRCGQQSVAVSEVSCAQNWLSEQHIPLHEFVWVEQFYLQPLKLVQWHEDGMLDKIQALYSFASHLKESHNFAEVQGILTEHTQLNSVFYVFINQQLKYRLQQGLGFSAYNDAQKALHRFMLDTQQILGLNQSLGLAKLIYTLQNAIK
ncbi:DNA polymerase III subunit [Pseudoalteromonas aurantia]|uniref:DNA-directed DNA polymerase n=1 Tax=Pseudoalteromonas aurantia 208 TaxID=1314867 RepID=A0ABR9E9Q2_9GAMM|nr:DNA polymerase III subunit [Pseudoalteromonas aurantia]MBE0367707.1 DNA polymerase III subunit delta' [Pseudoalteromonas aurantia 208]